MLPLICVLIDDFCIHVGWQRRARSWVSPGGVHKYATIGNIVFIAECTSVKLATTWYALRRANFCRRRRAPPGWPRQGHFLFRRLSFVDLFPYYGHFACTSFPPRRLLLPGAKSPSHISTTHSTTKSKMASKEFDDKAAAAPKQHKIRITLTSRNVKNLEKCESRRRR